MNSISEKNISPLVYIIILNWNGWADTIECLESVFKSNYTNFKVIVCDNYSSDFSVQNIVKWAQGNLYPNISDTNKVAELSKPFQNKPISHVVYDRAQAEDGGFFGQDVDLVIIETGGNLGFAGGNNVGIRYALARDNFSHIWLLNNDTVVKPDALSALVSRMLDVPAAGICGSTLLYYDRPDVVQALGGATYNPLLATANAIGAMRQFDPNVAEEDIDKKIDYVIGASMLVTRKFIKKVGLMCEDYFLYYEEIDWAYRGRRYFSEIYAKKSIVYHKEGASIGSNSNGAKRSKISDYYGIINRLEFTKNNCPIYYPFVYFTLIGVLFNRLRRKQFDRVKMIWHIILLRKNIDV
ncbi:glycosyltransferase family 2 protein [Janthinobacterium sp. RB2P8]|uniref:glycosyltransferase family 2 protein n=1 Tax=Janthinobacterium sp. RB2P8 TaxID=3424191 RepID=UPI003F2263EB